MVKLLSVLCAVRVGGEGMGPSDFLRWNKRERYRKCLPIRPRCEVGCCFFFLVVFKVSWVSFLSTLESKALVKD